MVLRLTNSDRDSYIHAIGLLRPLGVPLHAAIEEYVAARQHLDGAPLLPTLKEHALRRRAVTPRSVRAIVDEILAEKQHDGVSARHLQTLRSHLDRFADSFQTPIGATVTAGLIQAWLKALGVGPRSRNNIRTSLVTLFNFARGRNYLPKGHPTEVEDVITAKDKGGHIGILTPKQMAELMAVADRTNALSFALGGFAGLRRAEIERLEWSDFNFLRGHITVGKDKAKTASRRLVPILPNLAEWLRPYHESSGPILRSRRDSDTAIAFAKEQGIDPWPDNALSQLGDDTLDWPPLEMLRASRTKGELAWRNEFELPRAGRRAGRGVVVRHRSDGSSKCHSNARAQRNR